MKNVDKFGENKSVDSGLTADIEAKRKANARKRKYMLFALKLFGYHILAYFLYVFIFSGTSDAEVVHNTGLEKNILAIFSVIAIFFFSLIISFDLSGDGKARREYKDMLKNTEYNINIPIKLSCEFIIPYSVVYIILQLPGGIFHHLFGYEYVEPFIIDKFYTMDMGFMEITGVGILGVVINTLLFAMFLFLIRFLTYVRWKREKEDFDKGEKVRRKYG